jgi:hypothetical protein
MYERTWDEWIALVGGPALILVSWLGWLVYAGYKRRK